MKIDMFFFYGARTKRVKFATMGTSEECALSQQDVLN